LKAGDRREGRKLRKSEVKQEQRQELCKNKKRFKKQHPAAGPGLSGALGPCVKMGKKCRGAAKVRWTSHAGKGAGKVKKNAVGLGGG
jgi:hypothetical protein